MKGLRANFRWPTRPPLTKKAQKAPSEALTPLSSSRGRPGISQSPPLGTTLALGRGFSGMRPGCLCHFEPLPEHGLLGHRPLAASPYSLLLPTVPTRPLCRQTLARSRLFPLLLDGVGDFRGVPPFLHGNMHETPFPLQASKLEDDV